MITTTAWVSMSSYHSITTAIIKCSYRYFSCPIIAHLTISTYRIIIYTWVYGLAYIWLIIYMVFALFSNNNFTCILRNALKCDFINSWVPFWVNAIRWSVTSCWLCSIQLKLKSNIRGPSKCDNMCLANSSVNFFRILGWWFCFCARTYNWKN